jgi:tRNA (mo5U34)-methyltransferase
VVGVDPTWVFVMQWLAQRHFAPEASNFVLPLRDSDLPEELAGFDSAFSMGVLYHRRRPQAHLADLHRWLRPGGQLVLETLVVDRPGDETLEPPGRYARMRNVHFIPSPTRLVAELQHAGFDEVRVLDVTATTQQEQRSTPWMRFESLAQCLDPADASRTIEGHPAPVRAVLVARRD